MSHSRLRYCPTVQLQFGQQSFDVSTRAFTLLSFQSTDSVGAFQFEPADAPDIIELDATGDELHETGLASDPMAAMQAFTSPVCVRTNCAEVAAALLQNGAQAAHNLDGLGDPAYLRTIEEADASLIMSCPPSTRNPVAFLSERVSWALASGISKSRLVAVASDTAHVAQLSSIATVMFDGGHGLAAQGAHVLAVREGARLIARTVRDNDVRSTRRTIDTVSELLERREPGGEA